MVPHDVCKKDTRLREIVEHHGARNWRMVAEQLGTLRSDVQCLHRYHLLLLCFDPSVCVRIPVSRNSGRYCRSLLLRVCVLITCLELVSPLDIMQMEQGAPARPP